VLQVRRRVPVARAARAVAACAARVGVDPLAARDSVRRARRRRPRVRQGLRLGLVEQPGELEDAAGDLLSLLLGQERERQHRGAGDALLNGAQDVARRRRLPGRRRAEFEQTLREIARAWIEGPGLRPGAVATLAVAAATLTEVRRPARLGIGLRE